MNYNEALEYIEGLNIFGMKLGLARITRLLELLDLPQERYRTIHVTGTNGKGSVSAMLDSILRRSDAHTGLYSSPHLVRYTERIRVDGEEIGQQDFADCVATIKKAAEYMIAEGDECPTQFEVLTAIAFLYFARREVEYAVIEVGLGGLLDSTNVITPEVAVITNVTFEHAEKCGGTLEGIAHHKAGIIKDGVPVVTAAKGVPLEIIQAEAEEKNADVFVLGEDFSVAFKELAGANQRLTFSSPLLGVEGTDYDLHLLGVHQLENSAVAIMAAQLIGNIDERVIAQTIADGLRLVTWPARFERIDIGAQVTVVDGAHNPAGTAVLRESLDKYFPAEGRVFLLGILRDKDIDSMLDTLLRPNDTVVVTVPHSERAATLDELTRRVTPHVHHVEGLADNSEALNRALELAGGERLLVLAGSLYLVGGVRELLLARRG